MSDGKTTVMFELPTSVFHVDAVVGQGAYGAVCRAVLRKTDQEVAIKKIPQYNKSTDTAKKVLREVAILKHLSCIPQIVAGYGFFRPPSSGEKDVYIVMDYLPSDLSTVLKSSRQMSEDMVRYIVAQLLLGLRAMHQVGCIHRDLSTRNILINESCEVRIADFGLARFFDPEERMSFGVVTQWYRAPEVITDANYNSKVDVWSVGVVMAELFMQGHLFAGKPNDLADQLNRIMKILGAPNPALFSDPNAILSSSSDNAKRYVTRVAQSSNPYRRTLFTPQGPQFRLPMDADASSLLNKLLEFNPDVRYSAEEALKHKWFDSLRDYIDQEVAAQVEDLTPFQNSILMNKDVGLAEIVDAIEEKAPLWDATMEADLVKALTPPEEDGAEGGAEDAA